MTTSWFGPIQIPDDPDWVQLRPVRKVRGQRRYYRSLDRKAARFHVELRGWYDLKHWHVDWGGLGNFSWRGRRAHLAALFTMYRRLLAQTRAWQEPHQCWLFIDAGDGSNDAVYLHTRNPNQDNFPLDFKWVVWEADVPARLREFMTDPAWQFGLSDGQGTGFYVRLRPAAGSPAVAQVPPSGGHDATARGQAETVGDGRSTPRTRQV
jgi:hypothetical protein